MRVAVRRYPCDKWPRISILLSHLCESIPVDTLRPAFHKSHSHSLMNRTSFMFPASCLSELFIFHSSQSETAYLLVLLPLKGNNSTAGNENYEQAGQVDRPGGISVPAHRHCASVMAIEVKAGCESQAFHVEIVSAPRFALIVREPCLQGAWWGEPHPTVVSPPLSVRA